MRILKRTAAIFGALSLFLASPAFSGPAVIWAGAFGQVLPPNGLSQIKGLGVKEGSNATMGTSVLVAGTVTVSNTSVAANSRIFLTSQADGGAPGYLRVSARVVGTSFTITSGSNTDTSTVAWIIFTPN